MAERLRFKQSEIEDVVKKVTELVLSCKHISKLNITAKDIFDKNETKLKEIVKPTINIPVSIYSKMFQLVKESNVEISWHGLVNRDKETNTYTIYDILLFPQINSPTSTTTDEDDFAEWSQKLIMDMNFPIQDLRMHGHSHVHMNVFSSGVDDAYQKNILAKVEDGDYYLFLILNKRHEICALLYDFDQQILFTTNDIDIIITDSENNDIQKWAKEQIQKYCEEKTYNKTKNNNFYQFPNALNIYNSDDSPFLKDTKIAPSKDYKNNKRTTWT